MLKPVCCRCQRFYRPARNGTFFIEGRPIVNDAKPGLEQPDAWAPYKLWVGDKWRCEGCGAEIIVGCGFHPVAEHYQDNFAHMVDATGAKLQINDC